MCEQLIYSVFPHGSSNGRAAEGNTFSTSAILPFSALQLTVTTCRQPSNQALQHLLLSEIWPNQLSVVDKKVPSDWLILVD